MSADDVPEPGDAAPRPDDPTRTSPPDKDAKVVVDDIGAHRPRDRYQIIGEHGRGGLGRVSRAHDRELDRDVAIKELISRAPLSEVRFLREALITARLEHPNIVPVHEAGRWPDGTPFYAMKLVAGRPLRELIAERHTVAERLELLHHVIAVADAIAYAHGRNIIHRDLKPANVIVGDFGETIVIDWGLAKDLTMSDDAPPSGSSPAASGSANIELTTTGSVLGTPAYMAPEQERGEHVDQRADVFAIGAMLWELCALHKVPPSNVRHRHRILRRAGIDGDLITIIDKSLDPNPACRYPDAGALAADLKAFKSGVRIAARSYSLAAVLAHWTRRHRGLALSIVAVLALAAIGVVLYVRNISIERDRANTQTIEAEKQRADATAARDRAQLSEINTLLEKDPTRALELLQKVTDRTPQYALLMSRATQRAAAKVIKFKDKVLAMRQATDKAEVAITTDGGDLFTMPIETGELHLADHHAVGTLAYGDGTWWYTRREFGEPTRATSTRPGSPLIDTRGIASEYTGSLFFADHHLYAFDSPGDVYRLDEEQPTRVARDVERITASGSLVLTCDITHRLVAAHSDVAIFTSTCAKGTTAHSITVTGEHFAALRDPSTLILDRQLIRLPAALSTSHELAMASSGLLAIADYQGGAWFVRPNSNDVESPPKRPMSPLSTAAEGSLVAWGYQDGSSVVIDTASQETWEFIGQSEAIAFLALDPARHRLVTASWHEIRIWDLTPNPLKLAVSLPCTPSQFASTGSPGELALNCSDGSVHLWNTRSKQISNLHQHSDYSDGLASYNGMSCSAGWEGDVICSTPDNSTQRTLLSGHGRVHGLISCPGQRCLFASTADGKVWQVDDNPQTLFSHTNVPSVLSMSPDGRWLASGAEDGSLILFDVMANHPHVFTAAHRAALTAASWNGAILWTAAKDGVVKRWEVTDNGVLSHDEYAGNDAIVSLAPLREGLAMSIRPKYLRLSETSSRSALTLDTDKPVRAIRESSDHRYLVAITYEELLIIDLHNNSLAAIRPASRSLQCLYSLQGSTIALCGRGSILMIDLSQISYVPYLLDLPSKKSF